MNNDNDLTIQELNLIHQSLIDSIDNESYSGADKDFYLTLALKIKNKAINQIEQKINNSINDYYQQEQDR